MLDENNLNNKFVKDWLKYCGGSESPFLFNLWSGLTTVAACLGRRSFVTVGRYQYIPNLYVFLIGPPAVRKSSAGSLGKKLIKKYTDIKFGPTDTGGKKQGLISSYIRQYAPVEDDILSDSIFSEEAVDTVEDAMANAFSANRKTKAKKEKRPPQELFVFADELTDFIGLNQIEMIGLLTSLFYPQDEYEYTLSKTTSYLYKPCLNLLGCTTPTALASHLPPSSIGQGFSSRAIMVYEGTPKAKIYPAPPLDKDLEIVLGRQLTELQYWEIEFTIDDNAQSMFKQLYLNYKPNINDTRFLHYEQRRQDHLHSIAMILAAAEDRQNINAMDVADAHLILEATEQNMPHALGEVGMDRLTIAKQSMKEMIEASWPMGVTVATLKSNMLRDMQSRDFEATLNEFINKGLCIQSNKEMTVNGKIVNVGLVIPALPEHKKTKAQKKSSQKVLDALMLTATKEGNEYKEH